MINDGSGKFDFFPLPIEAQFSSAQGIQVQDYNRDGQLDLILTQNFYGPQRETGRVNGGLSVLLHGNGDGTYVAVPPESSGLVIPLDTRASVSLDFNRDRHPDLVVAANNGSTQFYQAHQSQGTPPTQIRLTGPAGNPTAIGARVEVTLTNGHQQRYEIHAGSGYLSQSTPKIYCGTADHAPESVLIFWPDGQRTEFRINASEDQVIEVTHPS